MSTNPHIEKAKQAAQQAAREAELAKHAALVDGNGRAKSSLVLAVELLDMAIGRLMKAAQHYRRSAER
jgi:hypothetical protein